MAGRPLRRLRNQMRQNPLLYWDAPQVSAASVYRGIST